jgi:hypothetical protein
MPTTPLPTITALEGACWRALALGSSVGTGWQRDAQHRDSRHRDHRAASRPLEVAREDRSSYEVGPEDGHDGASDDGTPVSPPVSARRSVPPVAHEVDGLGAALKALLDADAAMLTAVTHLRGLLASGEVEASTGLGVEEWVAYVTRHTQMDRRTLLAAARLCDRFPAIGDAVADGRVSWPQLRKLTMTLRRAPLALDVRLGPFLTDVVDVLQDAEADALVEQVAGAVREWTGQLADPDDAPPSPFLHLQPRLDGTGGTVSGELDAAGLALLDAATAPSRGQLDHPGGVGAVRAGNLLDRLAHTCPPSDSAEHAPADGALPPVRLLVRATLDSLLERTATPAELLTTLLGGRLWVTTDAARRLVDERGAELRTIVLDDVGDVVGVGRHQRIPPGWLRDAVAAVHDTCSEPCCDRSARTGQLDHAVPWEPTGPDRPYGTTDIDNLAPLCGRSNRAKEAAGWQVTQTAAGRRTWHHPRTGITIDTVPSTWRPPNFRPAVADRTTHPDPPDDPDDPSGPAAPGTPDDPPSAGPPPDATYPAPPDDPPSAGPPPDATYPAPPDDPPSAGPPTVVAHPPAAEDPELFARRIDVRRILGLPVAPSRDAVDRIEDTTSDGPDAGDDVPF